MIHFYFVCISSSYRRASTRGWVSMWGRPHHPHHLPPHDDQRSLEIFFFRLWEGEDIVDSHTCIGINKHIRWILCQWAYSIYIWCTYDILYLMYDFYLMHDIIRLMTLLVNIWYVSSCTTLLVIILYYMFVHVWHYWLS